MLDLDTRTAILRLASEGHGSRTIAKALGIARKSVRKVLTSGHAEVPPILREDQLTEYADPIRGLFLECRGNRVRVHEELQARFGVEVPYSTLTRFCRTAEIGLIPKVAAGQYHFAPGQEMQHDTSPHDVVVGGRKMRLQCASLVMCFSRRRYIQCYPQWKRFHVKAFLTRALCFFEGASTDCMLDNSTVIMIGGTGRDAYAAPEMAAFAAHFGFTFKAHFIGDANRSARVEAPFYHVENNFYPGRTFSDLADLNTQAITWCRKYNAGFHKSFGGIPDELGVAERLARPPLPLHIPEPVDVHPRRVNAEGYVTLHTHRYSVPEPWIGQHVEVHETLDHLRVFAGRKLIAEHPRCQTGRGQRVTLTEHRGRRTPSRQRPPSEEERILRSESPELAAFCDVLRADRARGYRAVLRLHRMWLDYPTTALVSAVSRAMEFGLVDLNRIERMVLKDLREDFFKLPPTPGESDG